MTALRGGLIASAPRLSQRASSIGQALQADDDAENAESDFDFGPSGRFVDTRTVRYADDDSDAEDFDSDQANASDDDEADDCIGMLQIFR